MSARVIVLCFLASLLAEASLSFREEMRTFLIENVAMETNKTFGARTKRSPGPAESKQFSIGQIFKKSKKNKTQELTTEAAVEEVTMFEEGTDFTSPGYSNGTEDFTDTTLVNSTLLETTLEPDVEITTTTERVKRKKDRKRVKTGRTTPGSVCHCDLTRSACDVNCCCDKECSDSHKSVFAECVDERGTSGWVDKYRSLLHNCYTKDTFFFKNNTEWYSTYREHTLMSHLFCVVKDNLPPRLLNPEPKIIQSMGELNRVTSRYFMWAPRDALPADEEGFDGSKHYSYGDRVWVIHNFTLRLLELPTNTLNMRCDRAVALKYLVEYRSRCSVAHGDGDLNPIQKLFEDVSDLYVVSSPHRLNETWISNIQDCPQNVCVPVAAHLCDRHSCVPVNETEDSLTSLTFTSLKVHLRANGSEGYTRADMYFELANLTNIDGYLEQEFVVRQSFIGENKTVLVQRLSGNPGYQSGKPVIVSAFVEGNETEAGHFDFFSPSNVYPLRNVLAFPQNKHGLCALSNHSYNQINFRENVQFSCHHTYDASNLLKEENATKVCIQLQMDIDRMFFWQSKSKQYVAKVGNPSGNSNDWIDVLRQDSKAAIRGSYHDEDHSKITCSNLVLEQAYVFVYAAVEKPSVPSEMEVTGAAVMNVAEEVVYEVRSDAMTSTIRTSVRFVDAAQPQPLHFARGPHFHIHLPHDFFHPFAFNGNSQFLPVELKHLVFIQVVVYCLIYL